MSNDVRVIYKTKKKADQKPPDSLLGFKRERPIRRMIPQELRIGVGSTFFPLGTHAKPGTATSKNQGLVSQRKVSHAFLLHVEFKKIRTRK
jgi:hypothetical protein